MNNAYIREHTLGQRAASTSESCRPPAERLEHAKPQDAVAHSAMRCQDESRSSERIAFMYVTDRGDVDVLTLGEALACFAPLGARLGRAERLSESIGGAEFNTAVGLARLGNTVAWCSRLGTDPFGDAIVERARKEGIRTDLVTRDPDSPTAIMFKDRASPHEATTFYYRRGSAASQLSPDDLTEADISAAGHVHVTGISMWIGSTPEALVWKVLRTAVAAGITVSFDPNFRPQLASSDDMRATTLRVMPYVSSFLCNETEASAITGLRDPLEAAVALSKGGPASVIVKRGAAGVVAVVDDETFAQAAWPVREPVDPVGAGDAFNAGWIHAQLHGLDPTLGLGLSAYVAAQVVSHETDHDGFPAFADVTGWIAGRRRAETTHDGWTPRG
jgi:2-dehydro-3-deoxygluconokinase